MIITTQPLTASYNSDYERDLAIRRSRDLPPVTNINSILDLPADKLPGVAANYSTYSILNKTFTNVGTNWYFTHANITPAVIDALVNAGPTTTALTGPAGATTTAGHCGTEAAAAATAAAAAARNAADAANRAATTATAAAAAAAAAAGLR
jgi:hypothetical protein